MDISDFFENLTVETIVENTLVSLGVMLLAWWLLKYSLGRKALLTTRPRRTKLNPVLAVVPLLIWYTMLSGAFHIKNKFGNDLPYPRQVLWDYATLCAATVLAAIFILIIVKLTFARGLKGFGLHTNNIFKDFGIAVVTLLGSWPVLLLMFMLTMIAGYLIKGADYQIAQHQELESLARSSSFSVKIMIALTTIVIIPIFEEMLFRGIFQSTIRGYLKRPWLSIFISSAIFASVHANIDHWPVIFTLGLSLGYSYEKTSRLYPAIFIHALFNATSIISTMIQS